MNQKHFKKLYCAIILFIITKISQQIIRQVEQNAYPVLLMQEIQNEKWEYFPENPDIFNIVNTEQRIHFGQSQYLIRKYKNLNPHFSIKFSLEIILIRNWNDGLQPLQIQYYSEQTKNPLINNDVIQNDGEINDGENKDGETNDGENKDQENNDGEIKDGELIIEKIVYQTIHQIDKKHYQTYKIGNDQDIINKNNTIIEYPITINITDTNDNFNLKFVSSLEDSIPLNQQSWTIKDLKFFIDECDQSCSSCTGPTRFDCLSCPLNSNKIQYLDGEDGEEQFTICRCKTGFIFDQHECIDYFIGCSVSFYLNPNEGICESCVENCQSCSNPQICVTCLQGFYNCQDFCCKNNEYGIDYEPLEGQTYIKNQQNQQYNKEKWIYNTSHLQEEQSYNSKKYQYLRYIENNNNGEKIILGQYKYPGQNYCNQWGQCSFTKQFQNFYPSFKKKIYIYYNKDEQKIKELKFKIYCDNIEIRYFNTDNDDDFDTYLIENQSTKANFNITLEWIYNQNYSQYTYLNDILNFNICLGYNLYKCHDYCLECNGYYSYECTKCQPGYNLNGNLCEINQVYLSYTPTLFKCQPGCESCYIQEYRQKYYYYYYKYQYRYYYEKKCSICSQNYEMQNNKCLVSSSCSIKMKIISINYNRAYYYPDEKLTFYVNDNVIFETQQIGITIINIKQTGELQDRLQFFNLINDIQPQDVIDYIENIQVGNTILVGTYKESVTYLPEHLINYLRINIGWNYDKQNLNIYDSYSLVSTKTKHVQAQDEYIVPNHYYQDHYLGFLEVCTLYCDKKCLTCQGTPDNCTSCRYYQSTSGPPECDKPKNCLNYIQIKNQRAFPTEDKFTIQINGKVPKQFSKLDKPSRGIQLLVIDKNGYTVQQAVNVYTYTDLYNIINGIERDSYVVTGVIDNTRYILNSYSQRGYWALHMIGFSNQLQLSNYYDIFSIIGKKGSNEQQVQFDKVLFGQQSIIELEQCLADCDLKCKSCKKNPSYCIECSSDQRTDPPYCNYDPFCPGIYIHIKSTGYYYSNYQSMGQKTKILIQDTEIIKQNLDGLHVIILDKIGKVYKYEIFQLLQFDQIQQFLEDNVQVGIKVIFAAQNSIVGLDTSIFSQFGMIDNELQELEIKDRQPFIFVGQKGGLQGTAYYEIAEPNQLAVEFQKCLIFQCSPQCLTCHESKNNCQECSDTVTRNSETIPDCFCQDGFFEAYQAKCQPCPEICSICITFTQCTACISGYYFSNGFCKKCESKYGSCIVWQDNTPCRNFTKELLAHLPLKDKYICGLTCNGEGRNSDTFLCECDHGYFEYFNQKEYLCQKCQYQCTECSFFENNCLQCRGDRINPPQCECPIGMIDMGQELCVCDYNTKRILKKDNVCYAQCPFGTFSLIIDKKLNFGICEKCHQTCESCYNGGQYECLSCFNNAIIFLGQCITQQDCIKKDGHYIITSTQNSFICAQCTIQNCQKCLSKSICGQCIKNYYFYKGQCYQICPSKVTVIDGMQYQDITEYLDYIKNVLEHQPDQGMLDYIQNVYNSQKIEIIDDKNFIYEYQKCKECEINCQECLVTSNNCSLCYNSNILLPNKDDNQQQSCVDISKMLANEICIYKESLFFNFQKKQCMQCPSTCFKCDEQKCTECIEGHELNKKFECINSDGIDNPNTKSQMKETVQTYVAASLVNTMFMMVFMNPVILFHFLQILQYITYIIYIDREYPPLIVNFFDAFSNLWEAMPRYIVIDILDMDINFMNLNNISQETTRKLNDSYILRNENGIESLFLYNNFTNLIAFLSIFLFYLILKVFLGKKKWHHILEWDVFLGDVYAQILPLSIFIFLQLANLINFNWVCFLSMAVAFLCLFGLFYVFILGIIAINYTFTLKKLKKTKIHNKQWQQQVALEEIRVFNKLSIFMEGLKQQKHKKLQSYFILIQMAQRVILAYVIVYYFRKKYYLIQQTLLIFLHFFQLFLLMEWKPYESSFVNFVSIVTEINLILANLIAQYYLSDFRVVENIDQWNRVGWVLIILLIFVFSLHTLSIVVLAVTNFINSRQRRKLKNKLEQEQKRLIEINEKFFKRQQSIQSQQSEWNFVQKKNQNEIQKNWNQNLKIEEVSIINQQEYLDKKQLHMNQENDNLNKTNENFYKNNKKIKKNVSFMDNSDVKVDADFKKQNIQKFKKFQKKFQKSKVFQQYQKQYYIQQEIEKQKTLDILEKQFNDEINQYYHQQSAYVYGVDIDQNKQNYDKNDQRKIKGKTYAGFYQGKSIFLQDFNENIEENKKLNQTQLFSNKQNRKSDLNQQIKQYQNDNFSKQSQEQQQQIKGEEVYILKDFLSESQLESFNSIPDHLVDYTNQDIIM